MEKSPWRRQWHNTGVTTHSSIIAWEIHGKKRLAGYSPWSCTELDMTEQLSMHARHLPTRKLAAAPEGMRQL